jgi:hypothetical protein
MAIQEENEIDLRVKILLRRDKSNLEEIARFKNLDISGSKKDLAKRIAIDDIDQAAKTHEVFQNFKW